MTGQGESEGCLEGYEGSAARSTASLPVMSPCPGTQMKVGGGGRVGLVGGFAGPEGAKNRHFG